MSFYPTAPPEILYTVEHNIEGKKDFGKTAKLGCTVQSSPDTSSKVVWSYKGKELSSETGKYNIVQVMNPEESGVVKYSLLVNDLQEADIGPYLCQVYSDFHKEDEVETWIRPDDDTS